MRLQPGARLGRYHIVARLDRGGIAQTYRAQEPALAREVLLTVISPPLTQEPGFADRFRSEAAAVARLRHGNVAQVFDYGEADGQVYLAAELLEGETLAERLTALAKEGRRLRRNEALAVARDVAAALSYAHEHGVVHGDVKPSNVLLAADGRAVLGDFGIAQSLAASPYAQLGVGVGTPEYMSPEQAEEKPADHRSDIYALGVIAYRMLTGRLPYSGDTPLAVLLAHAHEPLPLPSAVEPHVGEATERVLLRALAKHPDDRFPRAIDLAAALERAMDQDDRRGVTAVVVVPRELRVAATPSSARVVLRLTGRRIAAASAVAALLVVGVTLVARSLPPARTAPPVPAAAASPAPAAVATPTPAPVATAAPTRPVATPRPAPTQSASSPAAPPSPSPASSSNTYGVVAGDTLWAIAERFLAAGARWREIYDANRNVVGPDPDLILPGQLLLIPPR